MATRVTRKSALLVFTIAVLATATDAVNLIKFKACVSGYVKTSRSPLTVLFAGAGLYQSYRERIFNTRFTWKKPAAVGLPSSTKDVSNLVICANKAAMKFVVRDGGHSYEGLSSVHNGLVIDLSRMLEIKVNVRAKTATIAAGQRLGPVYKALYDKAKSVIPGGTCIGVGVSGLTLGGGIGANTRKLGLTVDHVLSATVVLASGAAVTASGKSHPDLFFAIRGGSGSFGIVTSWTFKLTPVPSKVTVLEVGWDESRFQEVMGHVSSWKAWALPHEYSKIEWMLGFGHIGLSIYYWGPKSDVEALTKTKGSPFVKAPGYNVNYFEELSYEGFVLKYTNFYGESNWDLAVFDYNNVVRRQWGPNADSNAKATSYKGGSIIFNTDFSKNALVALENAKKANPSGWIQGRALLGRVAAFSNAATAYPHRAAKWEIQHYTSVFGDKEVQWVKTTKTALAKWSTGYEYVNYLDCGSKDPWVKFFASNAAKLKAIKKKYDPSNKVYALC